jgi:hypothetical protein
VYAGAGMDAAALRKIFNSYQSPEYVPAVDVNRGAPEDSDSADGSADMKDKAPV